MEVVIGTNIHPPISMLFLYYWKELLIIVTNSIL
jgi:hypothetical protein